MPRKIRTQQSWTDSFVRVLIAAMIPAVAHAAPSAEELAKLAQNPIANLISVPFQSNTNFNVGPQSGTQNILNIQPVIPVSLDKDWNLITRTIFPVITQPGFVPGQDRPPGSETSSSVLFCRRPTRPA